MIQALVLAAAACYDQYGAARSWPAPVLTPALAARYPDGAHVDLTANVDERGMLLRAVPQVAPGALYDVAAAWAGRVSYAPPEKNCKPEAGTVNLSMRFFPPQTGITAYPHVAGGVNFDDIAYAHGPCYANEPTPMHQGEYAYFSQSASTDLVADVENVFSGEVSGVRAAVVVLRCQFPVGYNDQARLFLIRGSNATDLGTIGTFALPAPDDPSMDGGWLRVNFDRGVLRVDAWRYWDKCNAGRDWLSSAYAIRNGKLVILSSLAHHRASEQVACDR